jgi:hypothetical protein
VATSRDGTSVSCSGAHTGAGRQERHFCSSSPTIKTDIAARTRPRQANRNWHFESSRSVGRYRHFGTAEYRRDVAALNLDHGGSEPVLGRHPGIVSRPCGCAHIFQRATKKGKRIAGVASSSYDEDVICRPITFWGAHLAPGGKTTRPKHHPKPKPPVPHHMKHRRSARELLDWILHSKAKALAAAIASGVVAYVQQVLSTHTAATMAGLEHAIAVAAVSFIVTHQVRNQPE